MLLLGFGLVLGCDRVTCAWEHEGPVVTADTFVREAPIRLGQSVENVVALEGAGSLGDVLCERYAEVAGRVVNGWYPSGFDWIGYGGLVGAYVPLGPDEKPSVPDRRIEWSCGSGGLRLALDLPEHDARHESADEALADILSALPWRGLDAKADGMPIVVTLVKTGDVAVFQPEEGRSTRRSAGRQSP